MLTSTLPIRSAMPTGAEPVPVLPGLSPVGGRCRQPVGLRSSRSPWIRLGAFTATPATSAQTWKAWVRAARCWMAGT